MTRTIRIALLLCDTPLPVVQKELNFPTYKPVFESHLRDTLASFPDQEKVKDVELVVDAFDVVGKKEYPREELLQPGVQGGYTAVMMTGAAHSAYDQLPWLSQLIAFIRKISTDSTYNHLKIIGICFGMQVLGMALGGDKAVVPNPHGWEIGVHQVKLTNHGKDWLERVPKSSSAASKGEIQVQGIEGGREQHVTEESGELVGKVVEQKLINIQQMHRDYLPQAPTSFSILGSTPKCPIQGIVQYYPSSEKTAEGRLRIRILGLQGHPEFTPAIVDRIIAVRSAKGIINAETTEDAQRRSGWLSGGEGRGVIGWGVWTVLLE